MDKHKRQLMATLTALPPEALECRDFGHAWGPFTAAWQATERAYLVQLRCRRCATLRARWISRTGELLANQYTYPDGYLIKGMGRLTGADRDMLRLASVKHLLPTLRAVEAS